MKNSPHPWPHCQTQSYRSYQASQTPLFSNPLILRFDTQVCHEHQICLRFHRILKVILEIAFSTHCTQIWKLNQISLTIISKVAWKYFWCCHWVRQCVTAPHSGGKIVQWSVKASVVKVATSACSPFVTSDWSWTWAYCQISNISCAKSQNLNVSRLAVAFAQSIEARY